LVGRWRDLFDADFDVLLYDLTSTYFEVNASDILEGSKRRHGYTAASGRIAASGDRAGGHARRLVAGYEVLPGNASDSKTLQTFLNKIEQLT
jgi:hypothetical protein